VQESKTSMVVARAARLATCIVEGCPVFFGYVIAVVGTLGMVATGPGQTPVIGTTITPISKELGVGRTAVSSLYLVATIASACTLPFVGRTLDRVGPPPVFLVAVFGLGMTCHVFAAAVYRSWTLGFAFYLLRLSGQGTLTLVSQNAINLWFQRKRGRVMGACQFVNSLCLTGLFSSAVKQQVSTNGWRPTYQRLGSIELLLVLPLGALFIRQKPETYGLLPDNEMLSDSATASPVASVKAKQHQKQLKENERLPLKVTGAGPAAKDEGGPCPESLGRSEEDAQSSPTGGETAASELTAEKPSGPVDFTYSEAIRTLAFWSMTLGGFTIAALGTALFFHLDAIFSTTLYSEHLNKIYLSSATVAAVANLASGYLIETTKPLFIMAGSLSCQFAMLLFGGLVVRGRLSHWCLLIVGGLNGLSMGTFNACMGISYASWFGRSHNGKIQGLANSLIVLGSAVGPAAVSVGRDVLHSFHAVMFLASLWPLTMAALAASTAEPRK